MDGGKKLYALTLIASVVDTNSKPFLRKLGVRHGLNYATPSLRRKGLMFVSTTEAMSVRA